MERETHHYVQKIDQCVFTELAMQNAYFCVQHDMLVTFGSCYISLHFKINYGFIQQNLKISVYFISGDVVVNKCWIGKDFIVV